VDSDYNWRIHSGTFEILTNQSDDNTIHIPQNPRNNDFYMYSTLFIVIVAIISSFFVFLKKSKTDRNSNESEQIIYECPECGAEIKLSDKFCPQCGTEFEEQ